MRNHPTVLAIGGLAIAGGAALVPLACSSTDNAASGTTATVGDSGGTGVGVSDGSDATIGTGGTSEDGGDVLGSDGGLVDSGAPVVIPARCNGSIKSAIDAGAAPPAPPALTVPPGFKLETIAAVGNARELAPLPNGDLLVATDGNSVAIVPNADGEGLAGAPTTFATFADSPAQGIAFDPATCTVFVGTQHGIYSLPYVDAQQTATPGAPIATVRSGGISGTDGDTHTSTSVAVANGVLYAGVGSSCNACVESDPTRATVQMMNLDGTSMATKATRFRNAIALTANPQTGTLWAGGAGQDYLPPGHPYEFIDAVTSHAGTADYGWPACEENQHAYISGTDCSGTVEPRVEMPPYSTIIGAVFYPTAPTGAHAWPAMYRGGLFLSAHGSWHPGDGGSFYTAPRVAYVAMDGDTPATPVNWSDPTVQWTQIVGGFQVDNGTKRIAKPTGIAVGPSGTLFVADDDVGMVYRIRPM